MAIKTGGYLNTKNIYVDYPFEEVMFRRDHLNGNIYRKFYGEFEASEPIPYNNQLYNDALLSGDEISPEEYSHGKKLDNEESW